MSRSASPLRGPLTSVSALLVVGLLVGSSLRVVEPAVRDAHRDAGAERAAVRQLTVTLARAVRDLVGGDTHKPGAFQVVRCTLGIEELAARAVGVPQVPAASGRMLRTELLDLPPPAVRA